MLLGKRWQTVFDVGPSPAGWDAYSEWEHGLASSAPGIDLPLTPLYRFDALIFLLYMFAPVQLRRWLPSLLSLVWRGLYAFTLSAVRAFWIDELSSKGFQDRCHIV